MSSRFEKHLSAGDKLSLRISSQTLRVLNNDIVCFSDSRNSLKLPTLIADILVRFSDSAESSVHHYCETHSLIENTPEWIKTQDSLRDKAVKLLCRSRRTIPISLNNSICLFSQQSLAQYESTILYTWPEKQRRKAKVRSNSGYLYDTFQDYVAALLEEYAGLSYRDRERIYYREICKELDPKNAFHLTTSSSPGDVFRFWPRPGDNVLLSDPLLPYNYLVGYSVKENADGSLPPQYKRERCPASFRLSVIDKISVAGPSDLNQQECEKLEDAIAENGVAYLLSKKAWALVCFSESGAADFRKRLINRPTGTRMPEIESLLPGLPAHAEVWLLQDTDWKIPRYLRSFGKSVYPFSAQELTPEICEILIDTEIQNQKRGKKKSGDSAEKRDALRKSVAAQLQQTFMEHLKEDILHWYQDALSCMDCWDAWTEG